MKYLLIGGAENVGKTGAICRLTNDLLAPLNCKGFNLVIAEMKIDGRPVVFDPEEQDNCQKKFIEEIRRQVKDDKYEDFMAILSSENYKDKHIAINSANNIAIDSATDDPTLIGNFPTFIDKDNNISIIISSIRDFNVYPEIITSTQKDDIKLIKRREYFFNTLNKISKDDIVIELLLATIPEHDRKCYKKKINERLQKLVEGLLGCSE
jgi:hypothetical protein